MANETVNAIGAQRVTAQVSSLPDAATGAFQAGGFVPDTIRDVACKQVHKLGVEPGVVLGLYCMLLSLGVLLLAVIKMPDEPYLWLFFTLSIVLIIAGAVYFKKVKSDRWHREAQQLQQIKAALTMRIKDLMAEIHRQYEELANEVSQCHTKNIKKILKSTTAAYKCLHKDYQIKLNSIQLCKDGTALEEVRISFTQVSEVFRYTFRKHKRQISKLLEKQRRYITWNYLNEKAKTIRQKIQKLSETCEGWNLAHACKTVSDNLEAFCEITILVINKLNGQEQRIELGKNVDYQLLRMCACLDKVAKTIEQKRDVMKLIDGNMVKVEIQYSDVKRKLSYAIDDKDLVQKLRLGVHSINRSLNLAHKAFQAMMKKIKTDLMAMKDRVSDATFICEAIEACNKLSSELEDITRQMDEIPAAFAVAQPEGKLAREVKKSCVQIDCVNELPIFKLPAVCIHEVE